MHVHRALVALGVHAPDFIHQLTPGKNLPGAAEELEQQVEFLLGQGDGQIAPGYGQRVVVQEGFAHGQLVAGLKVAKAQQEQAFNNWQNAIYKAGNEVSNALVSYNSYDERSRLEQKQTDLYRQTVEDTRQLYKSSGSTYLEVISAQANLLNAEITKVTDDFYKMQAVVSLYSALGGGRE